MHKRDLSLGSQTLSIETGRLAKQADGAVVVRMGDTMVLVTACHSSSPREGIDFLPLTVDYREYTYASGRIPGGFFKREGKADRKGNADQPRASIGRSGRSSPPAGRTRRRSSRSCSRPTPTTTPTCSRSPARRRALALSEMPFEKTIAGVRVGLVDGQYIINPTFPQRKQSRLDLVVAGSKDGIVMVEAGAKEVSEEEAVQALETAHAAIKQICRRDRRARQGSGPQEAAEARGDVDDDARRDVERKALAPLSEAMRIKGKLENYAHGRPRSRKDTDRHAARGIRRAQARGQGASSRSCRRRCCATRCSSKRHPPRRPQVRRDPPITIETRVLPRVHGSSRVHARRDPGARHRDARHRRRSAEDRDGRRRNVEALHAPLQLPAVLGRRSEADARPRPPRDRPRRARRARARADDAGRRRLPLHRPRRLRHPRVERQLVDGLGLRRLAGDDGCRRADQGAGRRRGHGPHHGREDRQVRGADRHRRRRGSLRRHGLQGRRHGGGHHRAADGHQGHGHLGRDHARRADAGARPAACTSSAR